MLHPAVAKLVPAIEESANNMQLNCVTRRGLRIQRVHILGAHELFVHSFAMRAMISACTIGAIGEDAEVLGDMKEQVVLKLVPHAREPKSQACVECAFALHWESVANEICDFVLFVHDTCRLVLHLIVIINE